MRTARGAGHGDKFVVRDGDETHEVGRADGSARGECGERGKKEHGLGQREDGSAAGPAPGGQVDGRMHVACDNKVTGIG